MFRFQQLVLNGAETKPEVGDRLVYDERNGTLFVLREDGEVAFRENDDATETSRLFVGKSWTRELTRASAELYARLGGLAGTVHVVEGSFPTLHVYEVVD